MDKKIQHKDRENIVLSRQRINLVVNWIIIYVILKGTVFKGKDNAQRMVEREELYPRTAYLEDYIRIKDRNPRSFIKTI